VAVVVSGGRAGWKGAFSQGSLAKSRVGDVESLAPYVELWKMMSWDLITTCFSKSQRQNLFPLER
jgi:hypothetical protein